MKTILIIVNGNILQRIKCNTAAEAKKKYNQFNKTGLISHITGKPLENATFNLV